MNQKLSDAITAFPVLTWLAKHTEIRQREAVNVYAHCPICKGKWTLGVHTAKKIFHCFKCNEGGRGGAVWAGKAGLITMIRLLEKCTFQQACTIVYQNAGLGNVSFATARNKPIPDEILPADCYRVKKGSDAYAKLQPELHRRGVEHLLEECYVTIGGRYSGRMILPCYYYGELIGFEAKSYTGQTPKSLFPDWMDTYSYFYTTDEEFYRDFIMVTESVLDAETIYTHAIGLFGSSLKEGQLQKLFELKKKGLKEIYWMLDSDAMAKQIKIILSNTLQHFDNLIVKLPPGEDPNSYGRDRCLDAIGNATSVRDEFDLMKLYSDFLI